MLSINLHSRIFEDFHAGKDFTSGTKYRYSLQCNPLSYYPTWIVRQDKHGGEWEFVEPLSAGMQFTPGNSVRA